MSKTGKLASVGRTSDKISWQNWRNKLCPMSLQMKLDWSRAARPGMLFLARPRHHYFGTGEQLGPPEGNPFLPALQVQTRGGTW